MMYSMKGKQEKLSSLKVLKKNDVRFIVSSIETPQHGEKVERNSLICMDMTNCIKRMGQEDS